MAFSVASASKINEFIGEPGTLVVDLRRGEEYQTAHIVTAINIPYEEFEQKRYMLEGYPVIVLYCERGNKSLLIAREYNGREPLVFTLAGGFNRNKAKFVIDGMQ